MIFVDERGRPLPGHPGEPPGPDAPLEERIAWLRARSDYHDRARDRATQAFAREFNRKLRATR